VRPLPAGHGIREAKVDAQADAGVDDIRCRIREPPVLLATMIPATAGAQSSAIPKRR